MHRHQLTCTFNTQPPSNIQPPRHTETNASSDVPHSDRVGSNHEILQILREQLSQPELEVFIESMYAYTQYNANVDMVVDLDQVALYLSKSKSDLFRIISGARSIGEFEEGTDFMVEVIPSNRAFGNGRQSNKVLLTPNAFKKLCLIVTGARGASIREYFVKMESIIVGYTSRNLRASAGPNNAGTRPSAPADTAPTPNPGAMAVQQGAIATVRPPLTPTSGAMVVRRDYNVSTFAIDTTCVHEYIPTFFHNSNLAYIMNMGALGDTTFLSPGKSNRGEERNREHGHNIPTCRIALYLFTGDHCPGVVEKAMMKHPLAQARQENVFVNRKKRLGSFGCTTSEQDRVILQVIDDVVEAYPNIIEGYVYKGVVKKFEKVDANELQLNIEKEKTKQAEERRKEAAEMTRQAEEYTKHASEKVREAEEKRKEEAERTRQAEEKTKQMNLEIDLLKLKIAMGPSTSLQTTMTP